MIFWSAGQHRVHPAQMLMIGDSGNDSRAAQAAGSPVVLLTYGYSEGENLADLRANAPWIHLRHSLRARLTCGGRGERPKH